jgi:hypothetical protein
MMNDKKSKGYSLSCSLNNDSSAELELSRELLLKKAKECSNSGPEGEPYSEELLYYLQGSKSFMDKDLQCFGHIFTGTTSSGVDYFVKRRCAVDDDGIISTKSRALMRNEVDIYNHLHSVQGKLIPKLICSGCYLDPADNLSYFAIVNSNCGISLATMIENGLSRKETTKYRAKARQIRRTLMDLGVKINDFSNDNIIVSSSKRVFLIDFEHCTLIPK